MDNYHLEDPNVVGNDSFIDFNVSKVEYFLTIANISRKSQNLNPVWMPLGFFWNLFRCTDIWKLSVEARNRLHSDCSHISNSSYCVKMTGIYFGQEGNKRFCSARYICKAIFHPLMHWMNQCSFPGIGETIARILNVLVSTTNTRPVCLLAPWMGAILQYLFKNVPTY